MRAMCCVEGDSPPENPDFVRGVKVPPRQDSQETRLAGAVGANQQCTSSPFQLQVDAFQNERQASFESASASDCQKTLMYRFENGFRDFDVNQSTNRIHRMAKLDSNPR